MALAPRAMNVAPGPKGVKPISFEDGWSVIEKKGIRRLQKIVEHGSTIKYKKPLASPLVVLNVLR